MAIAIGTHEDATTQTGEESCVGEPLKVMSSGPGWHGRRCKKKPRLERKNQTEPVIPGSPGNHQATQVRAENIVGAVAFAYAIRLHQEKQLKKKEEEDEVYELHCFERYQKYTKSEFEREWHGRTKPRYV